MTTQKRASNDLAVAWLLSVMVVWIAFALALVLLLASVSHGNWIAHADNARSTEARILWELTHPVTTSDAGFGRKQ